MQRCPSINHLKQLGSVIISLIVISCTKNNVAVRKYPMEAKCCLPKKQ